FFSPYKIQIWLAQMASETAPPKRRTTSGKRGLQKRPTKEAYYSGNGVAWPSGTAPLSELGPCFALVFLEK
ncbi:MAG: hypothetical protein ACK55Z_19170, partial [bacterium]